jgi:hypothetical protein
MLITEFLRWDSIRFDSTKVIFGSIRFDLLIKNFHSIRFGILNSQFEIDSIRLSRIESNRIIRLFDSVSVSGANDVIGKVSYYQFENQFIFIRYPTLTESS